jgi:hypothetical protein
LFLLLSSYQTKHLLIPVYGAKTMTGAVNDPNDDLGKKKKDPALELRMAKLFDQALDELSVPCHSAGEIQINSAAAKLAKDYSTSRSDVTYDAIKKDILTWADRINRKAVIGYNLTLDELRLIPKESIAAIWFQPGFTGSDPFSLGISYSIRNLKYQKDFVLTEIVSLYGPLDGFSNAHRRVANFFKNNYHETGWKGMNTLTLLNDIQPQDLAEKLSTSFNGLKISEVYCSSFNIGQALKMGLPLGKIEATFKG